MSDPQTAAETNRHGYRSDVSVEKFLQLATKERQTCTVLVRTGTANGTLHVRDGAVCDAHTDGVYGLDALFHILSWDEEPEICVRPPVKGVQETISEPIRFVPLEGAQKRDEDRREQEEGSSTEAGNRGSGRSGEPDVDEEETAVSQDHDFEFEDDGDEDALFREQVVTPLIKMASETKGIEKMALVLRDGTLLAEHGGGEQLGTLLAYLALEAERIRQTLDLSGTRGMTMNCENGDHIVVLLHAQMVLGLSAKASLSPQRLVAKAAPLLQAAALV